MFSHGLSGLAQSVRSFSAAYFSDGAIQFMNVKIE